MRKHLSHLITINLELINENMYDWLRNIGIFHQDWYWDNINRLNNTKKTGPQYGTVSFKNIQHAIEFKLKWL